MFFVPHYESIKDERVFLGGDNAHYYVLAKSIASGHGFSNVSSPGQEAHNHFPPGYPFVMSGFMKAGVSDLNTLTSINGIFFWAALMMLLVLFARWSDSPELAAVVTFLCMYNVHLLQYSTIMMSEMLFLLFFSATLLAYVRMMRSDVVDRENVGWLVLLVITSVLMIYIRSSGIAVVLALLLHMAWKKRFKLSGIYLLVVVLSQVPWQMRSSKLGGNSYMKQMIRVNPYHPEKGDMSLADWPDRIGSNMLRYSLREIPASILPWTEKAARAEIVPNDEWGWGAILISLLLAGLLLMKKDKILLLLVFSGSLSILMFWPEVWKGVRFIVPLIPLLLFACCYGVFALAEWVLAKTPLPSWSAWLVFLPVVFFLHQNLQKHTLLLTPDFTNEKIQKLATTRAIKMDRKKRVVYAPCVQAQRADVKNPYPDEYTAYFNIAKWVNTNLPKDGSTVVCCRKPGLFYLFSASQVTSFAKTLDPGELIDKLKEKKVSHVVVDQLGYADVSRYLLPAIKKDPFKFPMIRTEAHASDKKKLTYLFGFKPELGYSGEWKDGVKHGMGQMNWANGNIFKGTWQNDTIQGEGVFTQRDGTISEGTWRAGLLHGWGCMERNGVMVHSGEWANGKPIKQE